MCEELKTQIAVLQEKIASMQEAKVLQAKEYERRLEELNHAHAKAEQRNADYLPRELFERTMEELRLWRERVDHSISTAQGSRAGVFAAAGIVISVVAALIALLPFLFRG